MQLVSYANYVWLNMYMFGYFLTWQNASLMWQNVNCYKMVSICMNMYYLLYLYLLTMVNIFHVHNLYNYTCMLRAGWLLQLSWKPQNQLLSSKYIFHWMTSLFDVPITTICRCQNDCATSKFVFVDKLPVLAYDDQCGVYVILTYLYKKI